MLTLVWTNCINFEQSVSQVGITGPLGIWWLWMRWFRQRTKSIRESRDILSFWQASSLNPSYFNHCWRVLAHSIHFLHLAYRTLGHIQQQFSSLILWWGVVLWYLCLQGMINPLEKWYITRKVPLTGTRLPVAQLGALPVSKPKNLSFVRDILLAQEMQWVLQQGALTLDCSSQIYFWVGRWAEECSWGSERK